MPPWLLGERRRSFAARVAAPLPSPERVHPLLWGADMGALAAGLPSAASCLGRQQKGSSAWEPTGCTSARPRRDEDSAPACMQSLKRHFPPSPLLTRAPAASTSRICATRAVPVGAWAAVTGPRTPLWHAYCLPDKRRAERAWLAGQRRGHEQGMACLVEGVPAICRAGRGKCIDQYCKCEAPYFRWAPGCAAASPL